MAIKQENKIVQITLTPFHQKKLEIICNRTGLNKTGIVQRWIEGYDLFEKILQQEAEAAEAKKAQEE